MKTDNTVVDGKLSNEQLGGLSRRYSEVTRRVEEGTLTLDFAMDELQRIVEGRINGEAKPVFSNPYLRLLYADDRITIPVTGGQRTIADAKKVFTWGIDSDFQRWGTNKPSGNKPETDLKVFEMHQDATFKQLFTSLGKPLPELCMTQDQIIAYCEKHKDKLRRDGYGNFFLFKVGDEFFVAYVFVCDVGELDAYVYLFEDDRVWGGVYQRRVVVPATAL